MIAGEEKTPAEESEEFAGSIFKLRMMPEEDHKQILTACPVCSVYEALGKRGWLRKRSEEDYRNHLAARHGLEA